MSAGLDLDALDAASRASSVVRKGTVKINAHLAGQSPRLTLTQSRTLQLAAQGLSDDAIARQLRCSKVTVMTTLLAVYELLELPTNVDRRVCAVLWWVTR